MKIFTYSVPDELAPAVESIDDLDKRVGWFVREQAALEAWRRRRHSAEAKRLVDTALAEGERLREEENPEDTRTRLLKRWDAITQAIDS